MAGLLGDGGIVLLSGSYSATTPAVLLDCLPIGGNIAQGPDGPPKNAYVIANRDTTSSVVVAVRIYGLHGSGSSGSTTRAYPIFPGDPPQAFQNGEHANALTKIEAWPLTLTGGTSSTNTVISGGWMCSRD